MSSQNRSIIVFGSGPGIGNHVAREFISHGFNHVILLARNEERLEQDKAAVLSKATPEVKVDTLRLDLSDLSSIPPTLKKIEELVGDVEAVFFNAVRVKTSDVLGVPIEEIEEDFKTTNLALYVVAQWAIPRLQALAKSNPSAKPSLLVTNSHLPWDPAPDFLSLSLVKASQRNMVMNFSRAFGETGVHIGLISVEGVVAPQNKNLNPANIAEKTWGFFEGGKGLEVNIKE
ncbi:short-chain dehydrogenase/reductase-like protein SDR [Zopfia rhizophila CBS 207.26]|uniref:Short-chain dehydrogenase/reductase-like protein SDR n=1 Tax=Zopfia rhizophila CBS 207.26 TaxID=1314779 RepID=A0A6A6DSB9_9PEZI|nr:short-chain dehydrogenase/reductase-like protein SDR [Zopfia rhizophila CBS 207.26]